MTGQLRLNLQSCAEKLFVADGKVEGVLTVYTLNEVTINKIKIGVIGKIIIEADENDNGGNPTATEEIFFESKEITCYSTDLKDDGDEDVQSVAFAVPLKSNLPPTIMVQEGSIRYQLYASMEEQFLDGTTQIVKTQANISVTNIVNCNVIPKSKNEKVVRLDPMPSCLCIPVQTQSDYLQLYRRAFVPGDSIKINGRVFNSSNDTIRLVQVALFQKVKLMCGNRTVKCQYVVAERNRGSIMSGTDQPLLEYIRIPPLPPTTDNKNLKITYKLKLIKMKQIGDTPLPKPTLSMRVVIGNLPLDMTLANFDQLPHGDILESNLLPIPEPFQEYARAENCIQMIEGSKFVPLYITYMTERAMENIELLDN